MKALLPILLSFSFPCFAQLPDISVQHVTVVKTKLTNTSPYIYNLNFKVVLKNNGNTPVMNTDSVYLYWKEQPSPYINFARFKVSGITLNVNDSVWIDNLFQSLNSPFDMANSKFCMKAVTIRNGSALDKDTTNNEACELINSTGLNSYTNAQHLSIFPNPTNDILTIESQQELKRTNIAIFDQQGRLMKFNPTYLTPNKLEINTSSLVAGTYFLKIVQDHETMKFRFVKK